MTKRPYLAPLLLLTLLGSNTLAQTPPPAQPAPAPAEAATLLNHAPTPGLATIVGNNLFDPGRQPWPDRLPPAPPPPPPPPFNASDIEVFGIIHADERRRAIARLSGSLARNNANGRPYHVLAEGEQLGTWRIARITPSHLVLAAGGSEQQVTLTQRRDSRAQIAAAPPPPVIQGATPTQAPAAAPVNPSDGIPATTAPASAPTQPAPATQVTPAAPTQPENTANPNSGTGFKSLAEAIAAAQRTSGNSPPPVNPFAPR